MISIDTETTGLDFWHGARPYFVTTCDEQGNQLFWRWDINPETREVKVVDEDLIDIHKLIDGAEGVVGQNIKFDCHALHHAGIDGKTWPWGRTQDTLIAGHLLASSLPHNLTDMAIQYLGVDVEPYEKALEKATQEARRWCRTHLPSWAIARDGRPDMPSVKEKTWKMDAWLPLTLRQLEDHGPEEWDTVLEDYANADSGVTLALWGAMSQELKRRGLWEIYEERMKLPKVIWGMEYRGLTCNQAKLEELRTGYKAESVRTREMILDIASRQKVECEACGGGVVRTCFVCGGRGWKPYKLELPKSGNNGSLLRFVFEILRLPVVAETDTGNPSLSKESVAIYLQTLPPGDGHNFITALSSKRKQDTSISYLDGYERFWVPSFKKAGPAKKDWKTLHPSINQTGTDTLRMSSQHPNSQNTDKHPDNRGFSLRSIFGPLPGREWWKIDYENQELRIPAFECGEDELIDIFTHPARGPYYGSYHLAILDVLHPALFAEHGKKCKDLYESTWYQWVKNGNFAILYGAQEKQADLTYHVPGAYKKIRHRFPKMAALSDRMIQYAEKHGCVETMPDKTVNPQRGYPLLCSRSEWGKILPTVPLNYHVSGTAMWCTAKAMVRCDDLLEDWREKGFEAYLVAQVHDEMVFDFPYGGKANLPRVNQLVDLMQESGRDIGVPLPAVAKWCPVNWATTEEPR